MEEITQCINEINSFLWGAPILFMIIGTGIYLIIGLRGVTISKVPYAFKKLLGSRKVDSDSGISPFNALMTSLSATVGTGNIVGVATAIALGGAGAVFWMWLIAMVGTATKFSEAVLAVYYREKNDKGEYVGGPMYYIQNGLGQKFPHIAKYLALTFALLAGLGGFASGNMVQSHAIASALYETFDVPKLVSAIVIFLLIFSVLVGGIKRISDVAGKIVPLMAFIYLGGSCLVLVTFYDQIPVAFALIFKEAFAPMAAGGGIVGGFIALLSSDATRFGASRGVFSNEAGMGSAPIAHAAAETEGPVQQGVIAMLGTVIDTLIICTITALVILVSGALNTNLEGVALTAYGFTAALPSLGSYIISFSLPIFAFTTILGWSYYAERCWAYVIGEKCVIPFRIIWSVFAAFGAMMKLDFVWLVTELATAIMVVPNLLGLLLLSPVVFKLSREFFAKDTEEQDSAFI